MAAIITINAINGPVRSKKSLEFNYMLDRQEENKLQRMTKLANVNWDAPGARNSILSPLNFPNQSRRVSTLSEFQIPMPEYQYRTPIFSPNSDRDVKI